MVVVILARQNSQRLPLKHLYPLILGDNTFDFLAMRFKQWAPLSKILLAVGPTDRLYEEIGRSHGWMTFRSGFIPEEDVLERVYRAIEPFPEKTRVVIINGDSPLVDPQEINALLPDTGDIEVTAPHGHRVKILWKETIRKLRRQREHPFEDLPRVARYDLGEGRLTIDTWDDVVRLREVIRNGGGWYGELGAYLRAAADYDRAHDRKSNPGGYAGVNPTAASPPGR